MQINEITQQVIGAAIEVHRELGPGLLESTYEACLAVELATRGLAFQRQWPLPVIYKGRRVPCGYRIDFYVERTVIVEVKAVARMDSIYTAQVLTYLKIAKCKVGLLINFNVRVLKDGINRLILG